MQVNNNYSPNFGMALRIHPKAKAKLQQESLEYLSKLRYIGEELQGHKYVDLDLGESLTPVVNRRGCANAYKDYFKPINVNGKGVEVETRWAGNNVSGIQYGDTYKTYLKFASEEEAKAAYESLQDARSQGHLDSALEFTKLVEKSEIYKAEVEAEKAAHQAKVNAEVDKLLSDFPDVDA